MLLYLYMDGDDAKPREDAIGKEKGYERLGKLNQVYLAIISRYKDYIEDKESISVAELPILITPKDRLVARLADDIRNSFAQYDYESDFKEASMRAFSFVRDKVDDVALPLQFWLSVEEVLTFMVGDTMDKNILLCSVLISLGNPSAKVLAVVKDNAQRILVYYELAGRLQVFELDKGAREFGSFEELKKHISVDDDSTAYEFNDKMYVDIS